MIKEIIVLRIKDDRLRDFPQIRRELQKKVGTPPGFIGSSVTQSVQDETVFIDITQWESEEDMHDFNEKFRALDYAADLKECVQDGKPVFVGCFGDDEVVST